MADQMTLKIKEESDEENDCYVQYNPASYHILKKEIKMESETFLKVGNVKLEPVEETEPPQQIEEVAASVSTTFESAACSSNFPGWQELTKCEKNSSLERSCQPCIVILERIDWISAASVAEVCGPNTGVKVEWESAIESVDEPVKTEEVDISDIEFPTESDSGDENALTELPPSTCVKEKPLQHETCQQPFISELKWESHVLSQPSWKPCACQLCGVEFWDKISLQTHACTHADKKRVALEVEKFTSNRNQNSNKLFHTQTKKKPVVCDICSKQFTQIASLKVHLLRHKGLKPHACQLCNKKFTTSSDLNRHLFKHKNVKPFSCGICSSCFTERGSLNIHMTLHTELPQYQCTVCFHRFRQKSQLTVHMRRHSGVKPYKCQYCGVNFATKCTVQRHELTHTDIRPSKCEVCAKCFKDKNSLNNHMGVHTDSRRYECEDCDKKFARKSHLQRHVLSHRHQGVSDRKSTLLGKPVYVKAMLNSKIVYVRREELS